MKLEQFFLYFDNNLYYKLVFLFNFIQKLLQMVFRNYFFSWKIANYADSYWFIYNNKKSLYETRYVFL